MTPLHYLKSRGQKRCEKQIAYISNISHISHIAVSAHISHISHNSRICLSHFSPLRDVHTIVLDDRQGMFGVLLQEVRGEMFVLQHVNFSVGVINTVLWDNVFM